MHEFRTEVAIYNFCVDELDITSDAKKRKSLEEVLHLLNSEVPYAQKLISTKNKELKLAESIIKLHQAKTHLAKDEYSYALFTTYIHHVENCLLECREGEK